MALKSLLKLALALWVARWVALELAAYAGRRRDPAVPSPRDSPRKPGHMPGPFDR